MGLPKANPLAKKNSRSYVKARECSLKHRTHWQIRKTQGQGQLPLVLGLPYPKFLVSALEIESIKMGEIPTEISSYPIFDKKI
uniref:Uncharacterized protein n=1 Tax=Bracon brevicornis TaxID=1563983 RepID=A0A6V7JHH6_9HYME